MDEFALRFVSPTMEEGTMLKERNESAEERVNVNHTEGGNAMTVFNYGFTKPASTCVEIEEETVKTNSRNVSGIVFRNYPVLRIDDISLEDCSFENCRTVYFSDCTVSRCRFYGVETVYADRSPINGCAFEHLRCNDDCVLSLEDSEVSACSFKYVELTDEAYLVNGVGDVWIENCSFESISTDREDRELFFCEEKVGKIFKKKKQFCIADTDSCKGLDAVKYSAAGKEPKKNGSDLWTQAKERGIRVERAMEAIREGVSWDESQWDACTLERAFGDMIVKIPVYNCLTRAGLRTVGDLVRLDFEQILQIKHLGKTVVTEVVTLLHSLGVEGSAWDYLV